jgi:phosphatidate cytidylyltransferase
MPFFSRINGGFVFLITMLYVLVLSAFLILARHKLEMKKALPALLLSLFVALCLSGLSYLRTLGNRGSDGLFYVFLALLAAWMSDAGAYFVGTFLGKHKLCPRISPKKTVEGLVGGIVISVVICLFAGYVYANWVMGGTVAVSYFEIFLLTLICAPLSVVGDLFASVIKRRHGIKDFGRLFPGHGGMMDRFDSLVFVFPVVCAVVSFFPLVYAV